MTTVEQRGGLQDTPPEVSTSSVETKFQEAWDAEVANRQERSPSFSPDEYTATGRASAKYGGKRNADWWRDNGPGMVQDWINWRQETGWDILTVSGNPCVEIELRFNLPNLDMQVLAYIDRVFVTKAGEPVIVDLKTGRTPESPEQLGLYRVGMGIVHGIWIDWGYYWSPGKGHGQPIDLTAWTPERFSVLFNNAINGINAGYFNPNPQNGCVNWCGLARYCAVVGGAEAKGVDSLAV